MVVMHALYLHGLASSPASAKATFFSSELAKDGVRFTIPDLNLPQFEQLSINAILDSTRSILETLLPAPTILMGSSMGAFTALHLENSFPAPPQGLKALVLFAPAFHFRQSKRLTPEVLAAWKQFGRIPIHHSATNSERELPFSFLESLENLPPLKPPSVPTLIIHGTRDEVIGVEHSRAFAAASPLVRFIELDTNHEMLTAFGQMVPLVRDFLKEL